jgi:hypothetical protein
METLILIVLLAHVIALLGVLGSAKHSAMPLDGYGEPLAEWQEAVVPARVTVETVPFRR